MDRRIHIYRWDMQEVRPEEAFSNRSALNYITSRIGDIVFRGPNSGKISNMGYSVHLGREVDRV